MRGAPAVVELASEQTGVASRATDRGAESSGRPVLSSRAAGIRVFFTDRKVKPSGLRFWFIGPVYR
jgi:hypothetical protein